MESELDKGGSNDQRNLGDSTMLKRKREKSVQLDPEVKHSRMSEHDRLPRNMVKQNNEAVEMLNNGEAQGALIVLQELAHVVGVNGNSETYAVRSGPHMFHPRYDEGLDFLCDPQMISCDIHPDLISATILFNAGQVTKKEKGSQSALMYHQVALDILLPHMSTAGNDPLHGLARILLPVILAVAHNGYLNGSLQESLAFYELALEQARRFNGLESPSVGAALNGVGVVLFQISNRKNDLDSCMKNFQQSIRIFRECNGPDSLQVANVYNNVGRFYAKLDDPICSLAALNKARALRKKILGPHHLDYGASLFNTAQNLHVLGRYSEALSFYHEFLEIAKSVFSQNHPDTAIALSHMGHCYHKMDDGEKAQRCYQQSIRVGKEAFRDNREDVAVLLGKIGNFNFDCGSFGDALLAYQEGLEIEESILSPNHPTITLTLGNIAETYRRMGEFALALECYKEVTAQLKQRQGQQNPKAAAALTVVGLVQEQSGDTYGAIETLQEALCMKQIALGDDHVECSHMLLYLGTIFCRIHRVQEALKMFQEALRIFHSNLGSNNDSVSCTVYNMGICHQIQGSPSEAVACFKEALSIQRQLQDCGEIQIASTLFKLGEALCFEGNYQGAVSYFEEAFTILSQEKTVLEQEPNALITTLEKLCGLFIILKEPDRMMALLNKTGRLFSSAGLPVDQIDLSLAMKAYDFRGFVGPAVA